MSGAAKAGAKPGAPKAKPKGEVLQFKSPAEFFAENQNIAGFDNPGKALYTTIREFVENALDAAESAGRLPDVKLCIEELDTPTFNRIHGHGAKGRASASAAAAADMEDEEEDAVSVGDEDDEDYEDGDKPRKQAKKRADEKAGGVGGGASKAGAGAAKKGKKGSGMITGARSDDAMYYRITCRDNGCGMPHERIPDFLGRVLAGSKYGVRQTRGKFGLGAKMALIWSKKSTGLPIEVKTAHSAVRSGAGGAGGVSAAAASAASASTAGTASTSSVAVPPLPSTTGGVKPPSKVSYCKLDIDIYKNEPHVLEHVQSDNAEGWIGTEIAVTISGAWSSYRARVRQYFQQLAVITPYAQFTLEYANGSDVGKGKGDFSWVWQRRSTQIPRPPIEVKHHPSSVNDLLVRSLIDGAKAKASTAALVSFLCTQFSCVDKKKASDLIDQLGGGFSETMQIDSLTPKQVHEIARTLVTSEFPPPSGDCLSPAGEYNLRLGIMKELRPDLVATYSAPVSVFEGHPFIVEAGVAIGGMGAEGLTVHRFANRIPLLFEGGSDVATRTAATRIPWAAYKIDPNKDKVGVFVSIVSTKIPFKGTGKEYIGDDIEEIQAAVKLALQACCSQLRIKLLRASAARARANRRKNLVRYVPDVVRALTAAYKSMAARREENAALEDGGHGRDDEDDDDAVGGAGGDGTGGSSSGHKRSRAGKVLHHKRITDVLQSVSKGKITDQVLSTQLMTAVEKADLDAALEQAAASTSGLLGLGSSGNDADGGAGGGQAVFIGPTRLSEYREAREIHHSACVIKLLPSVLPTRGPGSH